MRATPLASSVLGLLIAATGCVGAGHTNIPFESAVRAHFAANVKTIVIQAWTWKNGEQPSSGLTRHKEAVAHLHNYLTGLGYEVTVQRRRLDSYSKRASDELAAHLILTDRTLLTPGQAFLEVHTWGDANTTTRTWNEDEEIAEIRDGSGTKVGSITQERARSSSSTEYKLWASATLFYGDPERAVHERVGKRDSTGAYDWDGLVLDALSELPRRTEAVAGLTGTPPPDREGPAQATRCAELRDALTRLGLPGKLDEVVHTPWWHSYRWTHSNSAVEGGVAASLTIYHSLQKGHYLGPFDGIQNIVFSAGDARGMLRSSQSTCWVGVAAIGDTAVSLKYWGTKEMTSDSRFSAAKKILEAVCAHITDR